MFIHQLKFGQSRTLLKKDSSLSFNEDQNKKESPLEKSE